MNSKHTLNWLVVALALFAFICIFHLVQRSNLAESSQALPGFRAAAASKVQIFPNGQAEISASRTNGNWLLTRPIVYPAQRAAIEELLDALQELKPVIRISPAELRQNRDANSQYGFESPQLSLAVQSGEQRWEILVGNKTAPGDEVFLRVVGLEGALVADAAWLNDLPKSPADWRDTALVDSYNRVDSITLTNGAKIIELHKNPTNRLWEMSRPLPARANNDFIAGALAQLESARVSQFITDDPNADLSVFGLQPAVLDLWLDNGSNLTAIHVGKAATNDPTRVFARREGWNAVFTTARQPLAPWYGEVNDLRDPYLLELIAPVAGIEMTGPGTNHFILQRGHDGLWQAAGEKFPVDADSVQSLIKTLASLRVSQFVKDVVTPADLPVYGLDAPARKIILRSEAGATNALIAELLFGAAQTNAVFVRRSDEDFIYAVTPEDFSYLPDEPAWQFRERRIWTFSENDVAQMAIRQNGKIREMVRTGANRWSLAAGSQGIINPPAIEEVAHDLGDLAAVAWIARGVKDPAVFGLSPANLSIIVTLKSGESLAVDFGKPLSDQTALAAVTLDGERWVFIFPPALYQLVLSYLTIPANVP